MKLSEAIVIFKLSQHNIGTFAQLNYCLFLSKYCAENNLIPYFVLAGKGNIDHRHGENWFDYYFTHKQLSQEGRRQALKKYANGDYCEIHNRYSINELTRGNKDNEIQNEFTTLRAGKLLFNHYIKIQDYVLKAAEDFYLKTFLNKKVLGIHYRGLDKHREAYIFENSFVLSIIEKYKSRFDSIFIASDEPEFIKYISQNISGKKIFIYSSPSGKVHFEDNSNNYQKGLNALVDSILLSKCDLLIKTPSLLSAWSKLFNPKLPVVLIGRPGLYPNDERRIQGYGYYPECILYQEGYFKKLRNRVKQVILPANSAV